MYFEAYNKHIETFEINVQFYIGIWLLLAFLRQLLSWTVTPQLGPIVSTIIVMFKDVGQFIIVWLFVLMGYASVGFITFREVPELKSMEDAIVFFFQTAFVNYEMDVFEVYDDRPNMKRLGKYFVLSFVFLNAVVLLNVVIAMMADTYGYMTSLRIGIYNHSVIKTAPSYASNKHYGALAFLCAPFATFAFFTIPYYLCVKDKERLERFTTRFNKGIYAPLCFFTSIVFLVINLLLVPFAYVKTCWHKIKLARANLIPVKDVVSYVLFGLFRGIIVQVPDFWGFLKISWSTKKPINVGKTFTIDRSTFEMFYQLIKDLDQ